MVTRKKGAGTEYGLSGIGVRGTAWQQWAGISCISVGELPSIVSVDLHAPTVGPSAQLRVELSRRFQSGLCQFVSIVNS